MGNTALERMLECAAIYGGARNLAMADHHIPGVKWENAELAFQDALELVQFFQRRFSEETRLFHTKIAAYSPEDFIYNLGGPDPDIIYVNGIQVRVSTLEQFPALEGQGLSMVVAHLDACSINLPHVHPRAAEMLYMVTGEQLRVAFVEEGGGSGAVVNDISPGDVTFFPQGLVHYQQNLNCEPATFVVSLSSEDPGIVPIVTLIFELPTEAIQASLNIYGPEITALMASLPDAPALARLDCLAKCGLTDDDDSSIPTKPCADDDNVEIVPADDDVGSGDDKKNLRA